jgi:hypothetical protein
MTTPTLIQRLADEADLCRHDGADDIAALLDEAAAALAQPVPDAVPPEPQHIRDFWQAAAKAGEALAASGGDGRAFCNAVDRLSAAILHPEDSAPKPLTEEQVWCNDAIMEVNAHAGLAMRWLMELTRAIEAAHGIVQAPTHEPRQDETGEWS